MYLNKDLKVKRKCTGIWKEIVPGRGKGDVKGRSMTGTSESRKKASWVLGRGEAECGGEDAREAGTRLCSLLT